MTDGIRTVRLGETADITWDISAPDGTTITIDGNPTYSLFVEGETTPVLGHDEVAVTSFTATAAVNTVAVALLLDTSALDPGNYRCVFTIEIDVTTGGSYTRRPAATLVVVAEAA